MSGFSWVVTIDDKEMRDGLMRLIERMENAQGFYKNVGEELQLSIDERFENEVGPDDEDWVEHSPATEEARLKKYGNAPLTILRERGELRQDITSGTNMIADNQSVEIGTSLIYAAIHQFGGGTGRNHAIIIPARPYLGFSEEDKQAIMEIAEEWLAN